MNDGLERQSSRAWERERGGEREEGRERGRERGRVERETESKIKMEGQNPKERGYMGKKLEV